MISYLEQENAYTAEAMDPLKPQTDALYKELLGHVKETDASAPYPYGDYEYYTRTEEGKSYGIHCRRLRNLPADEAGNADEEIVLDVNAVAAGHEYCDVERVAVSPSHKLLAYSVDFSGYETYQIKIVDLSTGKELETIEDTDGDIEWGSSDAMVFYARMDKAHRPFELWVHEMGTDPKDKDACLFTEPDELFWLSIGKSRSNEYISCSVRSKETSEVRILKLEDGRVPGPDSLALVAAREYGVRYSVQPWKEWFFVRSNSGGAKNYQVHVADARDVLDGAGRQAWRSINAFPYEEGRTVAGIDVFASFMAVYGRQDGLTRLWLLRLDASASDCVASARLVAFEEDAYTVHGSVNKMWNTTTLRVSYSSMTQPPATVDINVETDDRVIVKEKEVPMYDKSLYGSRRITATARDGTAVPMSMVYRKDKFEEGRPAPLMLYGYGSYGACMEPDFAATRLPLLDRGMVYVIAHIRGGGEMGRGWYEDQGKYLTKMNTFTDFIDAGDALVREGYTTPALMATTGRSAGGLLMGACLNMRPDLFRVAIAGVPFVDLMTTMCDASIPLTVVEWEEWGNPNAKEFFEYMMSYSPIDNVKTQEYPALLITAGLNDPRVAYWEPAKWTARLRVAKAAANDKSSLFLKTEMSSGHFSASDRYKYLKERAFEYTFLLNELNLL